MWSGTTGDVPYVVDYKFVWQDANGMTVDANRSVWLSKRIKPGETVHFRSVAPSTQCKDFILSLKEHK